MNKQRILNLLGLAQRAGKLSSGDFIVERAMKRKEPQLILLAADSAANNEKKYTELADKYNIPFRRIVTKEMLGAAIGKELRVVVAVHDKGFAKALLKEIDQ